MYARGAVNVSKERDGAMLSNKHPDMRVQGEHRRLFATTLSKVDNNKEKRMHDMQKKGSSFSRFWLVDEGEGDEKMSGRCQLIFKTKSCFGGQKLPFLGNWSCRQSCRVHSFPQGNKCDRIMSGLGETRGRKIMTGSQTKVSSYIELVSHG